MSPLILLTTAIIPIVATIFLKDVCKISFFWGALIAPLSTGLYSLFFIKYIGIIFVIFLPISIFFNKPAWWILVQKLSLIDGNSLSLFDELMLYLLNGVIWGILFYIIACIMKKFSGLG
jgi:hypothetical protein